MRDTVNVLDLGIIRRSSTQLSAKGSWMQVFKMYAENLKASLGYEIRVLDSLDVLEMAAQTKPEERRAELFYLFEWLRSKGVTCFLISECNPDHFNCTHRDEAYLADGVVLLKMAEIGDTDVQRRIRVGGGRQQGADALLHLRRNRLCQPCDVLGSAGRVAETKLVRQALHVPREIIPCPRCGAGDRVPSPAHTPSF